MNPRTCALLPAAPALALFLVFASLSHAAEIAWAPHDTAAIFAQARAEGKLVHIFVEGDNCPPCDAFKRTHLQDPAYVDFVSTLFVNVRAHEGRPEDQSFLQQLNLNHAAVPRFYVLDGDGRGISMAIGMVTAPPMGGVTVLAMANGRQLPVNMQAAAALAGRIRAHAASIRASGQPNPNNPLRPLALAALEAQAWMLAGQPAEAETAFGAEWTNALVDQEIRDWYINFWLGWNRNLGGALEAAHIYNQINTDDPNGIWLLALSYAANSRFTEAIPLAERLLAENPGDHSLEEVIANWRQLAGRN